MAVEIINSGEWEQVGKVPQIWQNKTHAHDREMCKKER